MIPFFSWITVFIFLLSLAGIFSVFVLYPLAVWLLSIIRRTNEVDEKDLRLSVSILVVVRNAEAFIERKIVNTLSLHYPEGLLEALFFSDASEDKTDQLIQSYTGKRVRLFSSDEHQGKTASINEAAANCSGEIMVFTDADALLEQDAIEKLVVHFNDPIVGGVCGQRIISKDSTKLKDAQSRYIRFDSAIKMFENKSGSITSNDGKLYAIRRSLFQPLPEAVTDDFYMSMCVISQKYRFIFEPKAKALIRTPSRTSGHEVLRRRRIVSRSLRGIYYKRELLNPADYGFYAIGLFINKVLRRLLPFFLALLFSSSLLLAKTSSLALILFILQLVFYLLAGLFPVLNNFMGCPKKIKKLSSLAYYFCLGNYGTLRGVVDFFLGKKIIKWEPIKIDNLLSRNSSASKQSVSSISGQLPLKVGYIMSRFPKITETFILYEIIELNKLGICPEIYPLLREDETVVHPEVNSVLPQVHYFPLFSVDIIRANLEFILKQPSVYFRMVYRVLCGTFGSPRFFIRALAILPKSTFLAQEMKKRGITHIHAHFATHPALSAFIINNLIEISFSFTGHGSDIHKDQRMLDRKIESASFVVMISEYNKKFVAERIGDQACDKMKILHCGVDTDGFIPPDKKASNDPFFILCVASLREVKGHQYLLEACRYLKDRKISFVCHLVGDGPLRHEIKRSVDDLNLTDMIIMHGSLPRPEVIRLMQQADVLVLPSIQTSKGVREGIPVVLMEAMASELPVIASRLSGIPELIETDKTGILVEPGDSMAIADSLQKLKHDPENGFRMGREGRLKVKAEFNIHRNTEELARLFRNKHILGDIA